MLIRSSAVSSSQFRSQADAAASSEVPTAIGGSMATRYRTQRLGHFALGIAGLLYLSANAASAQDSSRRLELVVGQAV